MASFKIKHKIWFYAFIFCHIFVVFLAIIANPYRLLPFSITIAGVNDIKPKLYEFQRFVRLFDMAHQKPKTVLLGSSRILWGIDPTNPVLQQEAYKPVYNAGVLGPPMYEIRKYFDHALAVQPNLKRVILGIDFYAFNEKFDGRTFQLEKSFGKNEKQLLKLHKNLAYDVKAIFATLKNSVTRSEVKTLRDDGRLTPAPYERRDLYSDFYNPPKPKAEDPQKDQGMKKVLYGDFKISDMDMDAFRYIVETCRSRQIELIVFLTPPYNGPQDGTELRALHRLGIWQDYKIFLQRLAEIHPYWSFVGWNSITMNRDNYIDGSHFIFPVGEKIIKKMFKVNDPETPESFGKYVSTENVHQYVQTLETEYNFHNRPKVKV